MAHILPLPLTSILMLVFQHGKCVPAGKKGGIEELRRDLATCQKQAAASQKGMGQKLARRQVLAKRGSNPYVDSWTLLEQWAKDCKLEAEAIDAVLQLAHVWISPLLPRNRAAADHQPSDALRII
eukprot:g74476.t1